MASNWVHDDKRNALSDSNVAAIRACLARAGAVVFGWHYFYYGGSSRSEVVFASADELIQYIERARPGDHFSLYDLDRVAPFAILHVGTPTSDVVDLNVTERAQLAEAGKKARWKAVVLVQRAIDSDGGVRCCSVQELEPEDLMGTWEDTSVQAKWPSTWPVLANTELPGELYAFDETVLDLDEDKAVPIENLSSGEPKRSRALVDGKRPDDHGRTPLHGAY